MNSSNPAHAQRMLDHLGGQPSTQWPIAPATIDAAVQTKRQHGELVTMLRLMTLHLGSVALLDIAPEAKNTALTMVRQARALLKRCEGR